MARMKRMSPAARSARREARAANPKALRPMIGGELASTQQLEEMMDAPSPTLLNHSHHITTARRLGRRTQPRRDHARRADL